MPTIKHLAWCDLETTGRFVDLDYVIEVAVVVTTAVFPFDEVATFTTPIVPDDPDWMSRMNDGVLEMHTENGLLDDIAKFGVSPLKADQTIVGMLYELGGKPHTYMLSGSAVSHFDHPFIKRHLPGFGKWVQHPSFDIGSIRRGLKYAGREDLIAYGETFQDGGAPHRGLADIRDHINEWRSYSSLIASIERTAP